LEFCLRFYIFFSNFLILKNYFQNLKIIFNDVACHVSATWPKLHNQQLPRGQNHAISAKKWGQGLFQIKFFLQGCNSNFFFVQGRKSYSSRFKIVLIILFKFRWIKNIICQFLFVFNSRQINFDQNKIKEDHILSC